MKSFLLKTKQIFWRFKNLFILKRNLRAILKGITKLYNNNITKCPRSLDRFLKHSRYIKMDKMPGTFCTFTCTHIHSSKTYEINYFTDIISLVIHFLYICKQKWDILYIKKHITITGE